MTDTYKQMIEDKEIYINNDQYGLWQKKYIGTNSLDKALNILNNIKTKSLFEVMCEKNGIRFDRENNREN